MKKISLVLALASMSVAVASHAATDKKPASAAVAITESSPEAQKIGYSFGYIIGKSNSEALKNIDLDTFEQGFKDGYSGKPGALTDDQIKSSLLKYKQAEDELAMQAFKAARDKNAKVGAAFLADNAAKKGVVTTKSGLQYMVIKQGTGKQPAVNSKVTVNYVGKLIDGTVFDSTASPKVPVTFSLDQVIPGWTEGVQLMKEGATYRFFIPAALAYGDRNADPIPPGSTLIFDVDLIKVEN